ncbi:hypothetical protein [Listeria booriae]|uniref:Uncharacterized protein n=1 Tax=Listeria booriae TaxID=1552123 RepID=A0A7X0YJZ2_9LIST|nr:hypothetical protein [Listeria booriae]MBC2115173.1 hypothetical protein [Listeria booriae]MBC6300601.1 hypothetical protein [Listeria booriae]
MNVQEINQKISEINNYLQTCLWMDFEISMMGGSKIVLSGSIDQSVNEYAIEIEFETPYFISAIFLWHTDTSKPVISLANEKEFIIMNTRYRVEKGNYIFKINIEDFDDTPVYIAAQKIDYRIINKTPFQ